MPRLIWTPPALADVSRLHRFLAMRNTVAARRAVGEIRRSVAILASHPEIGRVARHSAGALREWIVPFGQAGYVVLYRYDGQAVFLLAVRHALEAGY